MLKGVHNCPPAGVDGQRTCALLGAGWDAAESLVLPIVLENDKPSCSPVKLQLAR